MYSDGDDGYKKELDAVAPLLIHDFRHIPCLPVSACIESHIVSLNGWWHQS